MAEAENKGKNGEYTITWKSKPLGFSIVMDTSGKNAYVSSIQQAENLKKGLKLAAQIIEINGVNVKDEKHAAILTKIKEASQPIRLKFQPRSFANDPSADEDVMKAAKANKNAPRLLKFRGAPQSAVHVNGDFSLCTKQINEMPAWQRNDEKDDPIVLWFWPKTESENIARNIKKDLWMIGRASKLNSQDAYACFAAQKTDKDGNELEDYTSPTRSSVKWKIYMKDTGDWINSSIKIEQHSVDN